MMVDPVVLDLGSDAIVINYPHGQPISEPITLPTKPPSLSIKTTMLAHAARDMAGQVFGRTLGLGLFHAAASITSASVPWSVIAGGVGAISGGLQASRIAAAQIGSDSIVQQCAVSAFTAIGMTAGAAIASFGTYQPVAALAVGSALAITVSLAKFCRKRPGDDIAIDASKATIFLVSTAASVSAISKLDNYVSPSINLAPKNLGVVLEATTVELFKSSLERWGPSVDRNTLNFNGKVYVSLGGLLPYLAATILLNGWVSGIMQPDPETHQFEELILPLLIGAIANGVRGACNAAAVYVCHQNGWGVTKPDDPIIRPSTGAKRPEFARMSKKTAIRFFLSSCRNSIYDRLVHGGMSIVNASILSQGVYGFFAQNRDLIYDLMKGEGWNVSTPNANNFTDDSESEIDTQVNNIPKVAEESITVSSASASETSIVVSTPNTSDSSTEVSSE
mgnify:CR=1 FL=1